MLACVALAVHELTGAETYSGLAPKDTRSTPADFTTQGWFTGLIPVTVPVAATFDDTARAAQTSFDAGTDLARVPFERVVELAPSLSRPRPLFSMLNFFDAGVGPLAPLLTNLLEQCANIGVYSDGRLIYPLSTFVGRFDETAMTVLFPDNPVARESVTRYLAAIKSVCVRVAGGQVAEPLRNLTDVSRQPA
jgi:hypothetical protein